MLRTLAITVALVLSMAASAWAKPVAHRVAGLDLKTTAKDLRALRRAMLRSRVRGSRVDLGRGIIWVDSRYSVRRVNRAIRRARLPAETRPLRLAHR